jgi:hypothetical protein
MPNLSKVDEESAPGVTAVQPSIPTFYINQAGSTYQAINQAGTIVSKNANADVPVNYAVIQVNNKGDIFMAPNLTLNLQAALNFVGLGTDENTPMSQVCFWGGGYTTNIKQNAASAHGIVLSNAAQVDFRNFIVTMGASPSGHGIFGNGTLTSNSDYTSVNYSFMDNIIVYGSDSSHSCYYLQNPSYCHFGALRFQNSLGDGFTIEGSDTTRNPGNCLFDYLQGYVGASTKYGVILKATVACNINMVTVSVVEFSGAGGGVRLTASGGGEVTNNKFLSLDAEVLNTSFLFDGSSGINYNTFAGYVQVAAGKTCINNSNAYNTNGGNTFELKVFLIDNGASTVILNEGCQSGANPVNEYNFTIIGTLALTSSQFVILQIPPSVIIRWKVNGPSSTNQLNPSYGTATNVADGGTITHNIGLAPTWVLITGSVAAQEYAVTAVSATTFTVAIKTTGGVSGTNATIYWRAAWNSQ